MSNPLFRRFFAGFATASAPQTFGAVLATAAVARLFVASAPASVLVGFD